MKMFLVCLFAVLFALPAKALSPEEARVKAALALAQAKRHRTAKPRCDCGSDCRCTAGECGHPNCPTNTEEARYDAKRRQAIAEGKPLIIWVGQVCLPCEKAWTDCIHAHVQEYGNAKHTDKGPCLIVGKPDGNGDLVRAGTLEGCPPRASLDAILNPAPPPVPQMPMPMMMPMVGGFGGGGGGC